MLPPEPKRFKFEPYNPKIPWILTEEDRAFLRTQKIDPEDTKTPYPVKDDDGA
jgi:hypothetical protein